ncbi:MAG: ProQ/FINO family protein [Candidatus Marithrix sp.]
MTTKNTDTKRITKTTLNQLAKSIYGTSVYCEHIRSMRRGWYLYNADKMTFIGMNANEAFNYLETKQVPIPATTNPEKMLDILAEKFSHCIFKDTTKIRPLQRYIHKKIYAALDKKYSKEEILAALVLYTQSTAYCEQLAKGGDRINLAGDPCETISQLHQADAQARFAGEQPMRSTKKKKVKQSKVPLVIPELDDLIVGKMEICVKISELPADSKTLRNGWEEFVIDANGEMVKITIRPRTWKKLQTALHEFPMWVAHIRGKRGNHIKGGFELLTPGMQIFEKHPKT